MSLVRLTTLSIAAFFALLSTGAQSGAYAQYQKHDASTAAAANDSAAVDQEHADADEARSDTSRPDSTSSEFDADQYLSPSERERLPLGLPDNGRKRTRPGGSQRDGNALQGGESNENDAEINGGTLGGATPTMHEMLRVGGALAAVIGLIFLCRAVMRRAGFVPGMDKAGRPSGVLEILARYPIARKQYLVLLKLGRRVVLVHQNGQSINPVTEVSDPDEVALLMSRVEGGSQSGQSGSFGNMFRGWGRSGRAQADNFHSMLDRIGADFDRAGLAGSRTGRATHGDSGEVVDLTRKQSGGLTRLLSKRRGAR